jgi:hypothetical protein
MQFVHQPPTAGSCRYWLRVWESPKIRFKAIAAVSPVAVIEPDANFDRGKDKDD